MSVKDGSGYWDWTKVITVVKGYHVITGVVAMTNNHGANNCTTTHMSVTQKEENNINRLTVIIRITASLTEYGRNKSAQQGPVWYRLPTPHKKWDPHENNGPPSLNLGARDPTLLAAPCNT